MAVTTDYAMKAFPCHLPRHGPLSHPHVLGVILVGPNSNVIIDVTFSASTCATCNPLALFPASTRRASSPFQRRDRLLLWDQAQGVECGKLDRGLTGSQRQSRTTR